MSTEVKSRQWHALSGDETLEYFQTNLNSGLGLSEVKVRQEKYGFNVLTQKKGTPLWMSFLLQFNQPLVYILLVAALVTFVLKEFVDASVIFGVVLVNAIVGFLQEAKALRALDALSRAMETQVMVLRDGEKHRIPSSHLVPGDVVLLSSGDKVAADMRILSVKDLKINESALTGESLPVEKKTASLDAETVLADRVNMLYASTLVTYGQGRAIVVSTGDLTEIGRISELIAGADDIQTPLTKKIAQFSHYLLYAILGISVFTFIVGLLQGRSAVEMFMVSVSLAVAAIPEGLPAAVTITLAIGLARMAKRRAIIRKLPAVETLGSTQVICSDKTGTLTENKMTVQEIFAGNHAYFVTGVGYVPQGDIKPLVASGQELVVGPSFALKECAMAGFLCNDSRVIEKDGDYQIEGDPTEAALLVVAQKFENAFNKKFNEWPRLDVIPFESEHQYMATLHDADQGAKIVYMKGSIEKILMRCNKELTDEGQAKEIDLQRIINQAEAMAGRGLRVLAFAQKRMDNYTTQVKHSDVEFGLIFLGLQGMIDPPRPEAIRAVKACHTAGICIKMITGDHVLTATAIARQLGMKAHPSNGTFDLQSLSGKEIESVNDQDLIETVDRTSVFARVTPEQKLRLVKALQARGLIVAMTGDGVNDAPALKQANIGVAMGLNGTEIAKEAADMVLTDDNFASIEAAVEEGRCVYDNLRKFIIWTLPTNLGEALAVLVAILAGLALPLLPVQLLWVNMTTAIFLGMMLAFEAKERDIMNRPPRDPRRPILTKGLILRTLGVGSYLAVGLFGLFFYEKNSGASLEAARTAAVTTLVTGELFYLFNCRSLNRSMFSLGFFSNRWIFWGVLTMIAAQVAFIYLPVMNRMFHTVPIPWQAWGRIILVSFGLYLLIEFEKWIRLKIERLVKK